MASLTDANLMSSATLCLGEVCNALEPVKHKWLAIGVQLGVPYHELEGFKKEDNSLALVAVINYWLKGNVKGAILCWQSIIRALMSPQVSEPGTASNVRSRYCNQQENASIQANANRSNSSVEDLNSDLHKDLRRVLKHNVRLISRHFASFVSGVCKSIKDRVTVEELQSYVLNLCSCTSPNGEDTLILANDPVLGKDLKCTTTIHEIFDFVSMNCANFLQYDVFEDIVTTYGSENDQEQLRHYSESLKRYINDHKVEHFIEINPKLEEEAKDTGKVVLKIDANILPKKMAEVIDLQEEIAKILGVKRYALRLYNIKEGCVMLTFLAPISVAQEIICRVKKLTVKQITDFQALSVKWIKCGDFSFNFENTTRQDMQANNMLMDMIKVITRILIQQSIKQHFKNNLDDVSIDDADLDTFMEFLITEDMGSTYETDGMYNICIKAKDPYAEKFTCTAGDILQQMGNVSRRKDGLISVIIKGSIFDAVEPLKIFEDFRIRKADNNQLLYSRDLVCIDLSYQQLELYQVGFLSHGIKLNSHCVELILTNCNIDDKKAVVLANSLRYCAFLRELSLSINHIRNDGATAVADCLRHCTQLRVLDLSFNHIGNAGALSLAKSLEFCTDLSELDFTYNQIGDQGAVALAESTRSIEDLKCSAWNHKITNRGVADIMNYRSSSEFDIHIFEGKSIGNTGVYIFATNVQESPDHCMNLQIFNLNDNGIGCGVAEALANGIKHCNNLLTLNLRNNSIDNDCAQALANGLTFCKNLQMLDLRKNIIMSDGAKALADSLKYCNNLRTLNLGDNIINSDGAKAIVDGLKQCNKLQILNLGGNIIESDGAKVIANGLKHWKNLHTLDLAKNGIGLAGLVSLANDLKHCQNLQALNLSRNSIVSDGAKALADGLKYCNNLEMLNISRNNIDSYGIQALSGSLKYCSNLQTLNISRNSIDSDGAKALAYGLKYCNNLQTLNISDNSIDSDGAKALADGLKYCNNLQMLNLERNNIESDGAKAITDSLKHCNNLKLEENVTNIKALTVGLDHKYLLTQSTNDSNVPEALTNILGGLKILEAPNFKNDSSDSGALVDSESQSSLTLSNQQILKLEQSMKEPETPAVSDPAEGIRKWLNQQTIAEHSIPYEKRPNAEDSSSIISLIAFPSSTQSSILVEVQ